MNNPGSRAVSTTYTMKAAAEFRTLLRSASSITARSASALWKQTCSRTFHEGQIVTPSWRKSNDGGAIPLATTVSTTRRGSRTSLSTSFRSRPSIPKRGMVSSSTLATRATPLHGHDQCSLFDNALWWGDSGHRESLEKASNSTMRALALRTATSRADQRQKVQVITTEMSLVSDPGDECTNEKYRELVERLGVMLESLAQHNHVWKHLMGDGGPGKNRIGCAGNDGGVASSATSAVLDDARQATDEEFLRMGTHTVRAH